MRGKALFLFVFLLGIALFAPNPCSPEQDLPKSITLLFGDSLNGTIEPCPSCDGGSPLGGLARRGSWVQSEREAGKGTLLLDSGDLFFDRYRKPLSQGDVTAQSEKAFLILKCYNLLGYDALGIGDDDLSLGRDFLLGLSRSARFPFLASNLSDPKTGRVLFHDHIIREAGGWRIGIFSLLSPHFVSGESDQRIRGIAFRNPLEEAKRVLNTIRPRADLIVLLSHLGYTADMELAEAVPGIDVILGGHSDRSLSYPIRVRDTIIVRTGSKGLNVGKLHVRPIPDRSSRPEATLEAAIPLRFSEREHPEIAEWVKAYRMKYSPGWIKADEVCIEE